MQVTAVHCNECGGLLPEPTSLPVHARQPCPECGSLSRRFEAHGTGVVRATATASMTWERTREYVERHPGWALASLTLVPVGAVTGVLVAGPAGVLLGLALGLMGFWIGPRAETLVRRIETGHQ